MKLMNLKFSLKLACVWSLLSGSVAWAQQGGVLPERMSIGIGLNVRPKAVFSQEHYLQDSLATSAGLHWPIKLIGGDLLLRGTYEYFMQIPRSENQLRINSKEWRSSFEGGIENRHYLPLGLAVGVVWIKKQFDLETGPFVIDESVQSDWGRSLRAPVLRLWTGVPLFPKRLQLNLGVQRLFITQPIDEQLSYGGEFRFEF